MKLLLTSGGITNPSIEKALVEMLGKTISEARALCIPTAQWGTRRVVQSPRAGSSWGGRPG